MSPKDFVDIAESLVKGYCEEYGRFLDRRRDEWVRILERKRRKDAVVTRFNAADGAQHRQQLLFEIQLKNERHCRRDVQYRLDYFEDSLAAVEQLRRARQEVGLSPEHPTIESEVAAIYINCDDYAQACRYLERSLALLDEMKSQGDASAERDQVITNLDLVRCKYKLQGYDDAVQTADATVRLARNISEKADREAVDRLCAAPEAESHHCAVYGLLAACDARVNHSDWATREGLQREFNGLWNDSTTFYGVPKAWKVPTKIAIVSDRCWAARLEPYVLDVARDLYMETASGSFDMVLRLTQCYWTGFDIRFPVSKAAAILFLLLPIMDRNDTSLRELHARVSQLPRHVAVAGGSVSTQEVVLEACNQFAQQLDTPIPELIRELVPSQQVDKDAPTCVALNGSGKRVDV